MIDEIQKALPVGINLHQGIGDSYQVDPASSYPRADTHVEIYVADPPCAVWIPEALPCKPGGMRRPWAIMPSLLALLRRLTLCAC